MDDKIFDANGHIIAYLTDTGSTIEVQGENCQTIGHYSKVLDATFDKYGKRVAYGNAVGMLIGR